MVDPIVDIETAIGEVEYRPQWSRSVRTIGLVCLLIATIYALSLLAPVASLLILAFLLSFLLFIPSRSLARRTPLPWAVAVAIVYSLLGLFLVILLLTTIPAIAEGTENLINGLEDQYAMLQENLRNYRPQDGMIELLGVTIDLNFVIEPVRVLITSEAQTPDLTEGITPADEPDPADTETTVTPSTLQQLAQSALNIFGSVTTTAAGAITGVANLVSTFLLAMFVSFLILVDLPNTQKKLARMITPVYHREMALLMERITRVWNAFFRGQVTLGIIIGVLTWIQLTLMGISGALPLAVFTGFISLIPTLGGFIAIIPLAIVPLLQGSTVFVDLSNVTVTLLVVVVNLTISQVIWNVVGPKILGDALNLPMPVMIIGVFIGAAIGGILGAFLVAPIMSMINILVGYLVAKVSGQDPYPNELPASPLGMQDWH